VSSTVSPVAALGFRPLLALAWLAIEVVMYPQTKVDKNKREQWWRIVREVEATLF
jgi:hypothetical protein